MKIYPKITILLKRAILSTLVIALLVALCVSVFNGKKLATTNSAASLAPTTTTTILSTGVLPTTTTILSTTTTIVPSTTTTTTTLRVPPKRAKHKRVKTKRHTTTKAKKTSLPYVGSNYGSTPPAAKLKIISDGFTSCHLPSFTYYVRYANGYAQLTTLRLTKQYVAIAMDDFGQLLPNQLVASDVPGYPNMGINHVAGTPMGCDIWPAAGSSQYATTPGS